MLHNESLFTDATTIFKCLYTYESVKIVFLFVVLELLLLDFFFFLNCKKFLCDCGTSPFWLFGLLFSVLISGLCLFSLLLISE